MENEITKAEASVMAEGLLPVMNTDIALKRREQLKEYVGKVLIQGADFGKLKNKHGKEIGGDILFKSGAEKLTTIFGLSKRFVLLEKIEDWDGKNYGGECFFSYRYKCELRRGDYFIADSEGSCNSWEKKYRYRTEYRGSQRKQILNPDVADQVNTMQKMAQKRALVAVVLVGIGASDFFTQDLEDLPPDNRKPGNAYQDKTPYKPQSQQKDVPLGDRDLWNPIIRAYKIMLSEPYESHLATILESGRLARDSHKFYESVFYNQEKKECLVYSETDLLKMTEHLFQKRLGVEWLEKKAESAEAYIANENTSPDEPH